MKISRRARALAVLAASASLVAVPLTAVPADAAQSAKCTKLKTTSPKPGVTNAVLTNCTPTKATGGSGSGTFKTKEGATAGTLIVTIKWAGGKGTTKGTIKFKAQATDRKCVGGTKVTRFTITGKVTGGTGAAVKTIKPNEPITGSVCSHTTKGITLEPGTVMKF
jgi:hypothetical protein